MQKEAPLCFELKIEYIGDEPSITIWHGDPIGGVELMNQDGTAILPFVAGDSRSASELEKGKEYSIEVFTGAVEYELFGGFAPGNYIAEASVAFKFGKNAAEELVCVLDLPFAVT
ncbi:MAG: hypothetical protein K2O45_00680 [Oscillospiraceae bacterium]|nr:hypothetical protein [Oscillospiraceae bacterium]